MIPKPLIVARYFAKEQAAIEAKEAELETVTAERTELEEEHGGDEGLYSVLDKVNKKNVTDRLKELKGLFAAPNEDTRAEMDAINAWLKLSEQETNKWLTVLGAAMGNEMERTSQMLTERVKELEERYAVPMPEQVCRVAALQEKVEAHLARMGFAWK